jgi:4-hydroxybenzoate polyprenyltransferase
MIGPYHFTGGLCRIARRILQFANLLSLDVVVGAVLSGLFAAMVTATYFPPVYWLVLALSVWVIYTADHLLDAYRLGSEAHTARHRFASRHFTALALLVMVVSMATVVLVIALLDRSVLYFGISCGLLAAIYLLLLYLFRGSQVFPFPREAIVALLYTAGVWGMPLLAMPGTMGLAPWTMAGGFFLLALSNALVLSYADHNTDLMDGHQTFTVTFGRKRSARVVQWLCLASLVLASFAGVMAKSLLFIVAGSIFFLMVAVMILTVRLDFHSKDPLMSRLLTEAVFWLPGLLLMI